MSEPSEQPSDEIPEIVVVDADPRWPAEYDREIRRMEMAFDPNEKAEFHHFGSTAVPGLAAKPVIDILAVVERLHGIDHYTARLEPLGYRFREVDETGRYFFHRIDPRSPHLHVVERDTWNFWRPILFRDALREDPSLAVRYEDLKRRMAATHANDREAYTRIKTAFILEAQKHALDRDPALRARLAAAGADLP